MRKIVLLFCLMFVCTSIFAIEKCNSDGKQTVFDFYKAYALLMEEQCAEFERTHSEKVLLLYDKKIDGLVASYCTEALACKQHSSDLADLLTDENCIDGLAAHTLSVKFASTGDYYLVSYQTHSGYYDKDSKVIDVSFKVYTEDNGRKISRIVGKNLGDTDDYVVPKTRPLKLASLSVKDLTHKQGWILQNNSETEIVKTVSWTFSESMVNITAVLVNGETISNKYQYYVSSAEPSMFDKSCIGKQNSGSFIVMDNPENGEFWYFSVVESDSLGNGRMTLFNDMKVDLPGIGDVLDFQ